MEGAGRVVRTRVGVSLEGVSLEGVEGLARVHLHCLVVPGVPDGAVDVEVVDDVLGLEPPPLLVSLLRVHVRGEHAVVVEMVKVVRLLARHLNLTQPFHHASADVPGDEDAAAHTSNQSSSQAIYLSMRAPVSMSGGGGRRGRWGTQKHTGGGQSE
eukprot:938241-Prorocentrum_minimum.AAC.2